MNIQISLTILGMILGIAATGLTATTTTPVFGDLKCNDEGTHCRGDGTNFKGEDDGGASFSGNDKPADRQGHFSSEGGHVEKSSNQWDDLFGTPNGND